MPELRSVLGLTFGELFVIGFIFLAVVSSDLWPWLGEKLFVILTRSTTTPPEDAETRSRDE